MENTALRNMYLDIFQGKYEKYATEIEKNNFEELSVPMLLGVAYSLDKKKNKQKEGKDIELIKDIYLYVHKQDLSNKELAVLKEFVLFFKKDKIKDFDQKVERLIEKYPFLGLSRLYTSRKLIEKELLDEAIRQLKIIINYFPDVEYINFLYTDLLIQKKEYEKALEVITETRKSVNKNFYLFYLYRFLSWKYKIIHYLIKSILFIILFFIFKFNFAVGVFFEILIFYFFYKMYINYLLPIFFYIRKEFAKEFILSLFIIWGIYYLCELLI